MNKNELILILDHLYELSSKNKWMEATDFIFDHIDSMLSHEEHRDMIFLLEKMDLDQVHEKVLTPMLSMVRCGKDSLGEHYTIFSRRVFTSLRSRGTYHEAMIAKAEKSLL